MRQRPPDGVEALRVGQREIEQQQIHGAVLEMRQAVAQGLDGGQLDALAAALGEALAQQLGVVGIVFHQQDVQRHDELVQRR